MDMQAHSQVQHDPGAVSLPLVWSQANALYLFLLP